MRRLLSFVVILIGGPMACADDNLETRHYTVDGVTRVALVYASADAKARPVPVVFAFHGHGGTAHDAAHAFAIHEHWPEAIAVYMKGVPTVAGNDPTGKQSGWQYHVRENGDRDVKFFDAVLESLRHEFKVDDMRIYVTGFSNGGGFAFVLWSTRGDQIAAVAPCAMHTSEKMISTFKPKPMLQIAGKNDPLQKLPSQEKTVNDVAKLNQCGKGQPWDKKCTIYPSKINAPVVLYVHPGGHEVPRDAPSIVVRFFKNHALNTVGQSLQISGTNRNPIIGMWRLKQPAVGESQLKITEKAGKLEVHEIGLGGARGTTVSYADGLLVIHWEANPGLRGYWELNVNEELTKGRGKTVFIRHEGFEPGEEHDIEGRKVRIVQGVTIERMNSVEP
jgi:polyhydroxybutyrate depolymerase